MIRTRFAPSPTGFLHVGGARTALYSYLVARQNQGQFILRIEDTDQERSTPESVDAILTGMAWLGLDYDEGPFYQTQRTPRYQAVAEQLLQTGQAYRCDCSSARLETLRAEQMREGKKPRYDGHCSKRSDIDPTKPYVIRFKNPETGKVTWQDLVKGQISFANSELDDLIIARSNGSPTYNFTVVVDDYDMDITHVIRGDDHINNTPRQINILKALGKPLPQYAHVPMILGDDGKRLSKRHGAESVMQYCDEGYLPQALLNYLFRLGFAHGDQEIFSRQEMIDTFKLERVNGSAAIFSTAKLNWLNQHYMRSLAFDAIKPYLMQQFKALELDLTAGPSLETLYPLLSERAHTLKAVAENARYFYSDEYPQDAAAIAKHITSETRPALALLQTEFAKMPDFKASSIHSAIEVVSNELALPMAKVAMPLRVALTGGGQSPPIDITAELIGKERSLARLRGVLK